MIMMRDADEMRLRRVASGLKHIAANQSSDPGADAQKLALELDSVLESVESLKRGQER